MGETDSRLTRHCAEDIEFDTIAKVVTALGGIRDDAQPPAGDGIAAFSTLYEIITRNVMETVDEQRARRFADNAFLTELDLQFARRYFDAIRAWEAGDEDRTPKCWSVLFDARSNDHGQANFAACGVNAHVNYDLSFALLETWRKFPPTDRRRADYNLVNDIFRDEMDRLREIFPTILSEVDDDGSWLDRLGNFMSNVLVVYTRRQAWDAAMDVWEYYDPTAPDGGSDYRAAYRRLERDLDIYAWMGGKGMLELRWVP